MKWRVIIFFLGLFFVAGIGTGLIVADPQSKDILFPSPTPFAVATPQVLPAATESAQLYKVIRIVDGDTIEIESGQKIRYIGMDTPETVHPTKGKQCFGEEAKHRNEELVLGKNVRLEKDVNETDRYGRLLRYVWVDDTLVNKQLVLDGFAFARSYPPDITRQDELRAAEAEARGKNRGLWGVCPL